MKYGAGGAERYSITRKFYNFQKQQTRTKYSLEITMISRQIISESARN